MRRRSKASDEPVKSRRRKRVTLKRGNAQKAVRRRSSSSVSQKTKIALTRELNDALEQQAATSEVLQVISRSPFDLQTVLDTLAARLCEAEIANIWLPKEGAYRVAASSRSREYLENKESLGTVALEPNRGTIVGRTLLECKTVHVHDVQADPDYHPNLTIVVGFLGGFRTLLGVPLLRHGAPIGVIALSQSRVRPFTEKQIKLAETFADQAVIAIENVRLFEAEQQRTRELTESLEQQTATSDVLNVMSRSTFQLQPVLDTIVQTASRLCDAEFALIFKLMDGKYHPAAANNATATFVQHAATNPIVPGRGSLIGRTALERKTVHLPDCLADAEYNYFEYQRSGQYRTMLGVPLLREGVPIGVIGLMRTVIKPFTDKQIELVTTFADQAVIAIENVRLFDDVQQRTAELTESLEQQTATSEVLQVISSSPGDLQPVFSIMLEKAVRICDATFGNIYRWDGELMHLLAAHNTPPALAEVRRQSAFRPSSVVQHMAETKTAAQALDLAADKSYTDEPNPAAVDAVELGGVRTFLSVPLVKKDELIGSFSLYRQEVRPFTDKQIELVENFSKQAVIAIENTRLFNELRQRTTDLTEFLQQQTATSEVLEVISNSPGELELVFRAMLDRAVRICEARFGNLYLREGDGFRAAVMHNVPPAYAESRAGVVHPSHNSTLWQATQTKQPAQTADITKLPGYAEGDPYLVSSVSLGGFRSVLSVPMLHGDELIGAITIFRQEIGPFTEKQIELLPNFAKQAVIAIENARLLNELRESLQQQTATADVLKVISRSTFDLHAVLDTLVALGRPTLRRRYGRHRAARRGVFLPRGRFRASIPIHRSRQGSAGRTEPQQRLRTCTARRQGNPYRGHGGRSGLYLCAGAAGWFSHIARRSHVAGWRASRRVTLMRTTMRPFTEQQIELVTTFADQAAIAIENVRLFEAEQQRTRELTNRWNSRPPRRGAPGHQPLGLRSSAGV